MTRAAAIQDIVSKSSEAVRGWKTPGIVLMIIGVIGLFVGFSGGRAVGVNALYVNVVFFIGLAVSGVVLSAIFQVTSAAWGRPFRHLAEGFVVFMPAALLGLIAVLILSGPLLPWAHEEHLSGGKHVWLVRGFWDIRLLLGLAIIYGLSLRFLRLSLRKDFCVEGVAEQFQGRLASWVSSRITDRELERAKCDRSMSTLAPILLILYAVLFTFLGFDLIMALDPEWFSTLFGAWYFFGHLFAGMALLTMIGLRIAARPGLTPYFPTQRKMDIATLLFAFCLVHTDFFWSQYLTIWYGNLPEETAWTIRRTIDASLPWANLSWLALFGIFVIPFIALLFRAVKGSFGAMTFVASTIIAGVFLTRFIEISPELLKGSTESVTQSLIAAILIALGFLGTGSLLYGRFLSQIPLLPVGDDIYMTNLEQGEHHS